MDFIMNNYMWFLIGTIVLVMIIIGYIAEKTDFGHKEVKKVEKKSKKQEKELKKLENTNLKLNDVVYTENKENTEVLDVDASNQLPNNIEEDLTVPLSGVKKEKLNIIEEDLTVPLNPKEDLTVPLNNETIEDLSVPLNVSINNQEVKNEQVKEDYIWNF